MKRNEFGELENSFNKMNLVIIAIAIVAVVLTGTIVAKNINVSGTDTGCITSEELNS